MKWIILSLLIAGTLVAQNPVADDMQHTLDSIQSSLAAIQLHADHLACVHAHRHWWQRIFRRHVCG